MNRLSMSLFMTQRTDSVGGFGRDGGRKKNQDDNDSGNGSKSKANKNIATGTSATSGNNIERTSTGNQIERTLVNKTRRSPRRKHEKNSPKKHPDYKRQSKSKALLSNQDSKHKLQRNKSSIKTSDKNTSLTMFKHDNYPAAAAEIEEQIKNCDTFRDILDEHVSIGDNDTQQRVEQLEMIVTNLKCEVQKLRVEVEDLTKATSVTPKILELLREAGLQTKDDIKSAVMNEGEKQIDAASKENHSLSEQPLQSLRIQQNNKEIFGIAPKSVTDAADAAGASILSAILAGKHRMLVDVRDAELTRDPKLFVEFIELAVLPVAAGLEGLDGEEHVRNRVKIVFPTVKELMSYRKSMALAAPEVVSLSTLGFDPSNERDDLIVVIAPSPDDTASVRSMEKLISRTNQNYVESNQRITQPLVVLNHHMVPVDVAEFGKFTLVYHLRLLNVQYMTGDTMPEYVSKPKAGSQRVDSLLDMKRETDNEPTEGDKQNSTISGTVYTEEPFDRDNEDDAALEAAMTHAHDIGVHQGVTRAMVIRAYPKPWHVFVDTSPDTDADFEAAATFDAEPTQEDVNYAIVECLEGSEQEDEIVAQQMQAALEAGQLNRVSDMLGISPSDIVSEENAVASSEVDDICDNRNLYGEDNWDGLYYDDWFSEDSV